MSPQVNRQPGVQRDMLTRPLLPIDDSIQHLFSPPQVADEVISGEKDLMHPKPRQVIKFSHDMIGRKVVRAIVVGQDPYIAKLTKKRTAPRYFQHGSVITLISCIQKWPVKAARLGYIEPYFRLDDLWE